MGKGGMPIVEFHRESVQMLSVEVGHEVEP